MLKKWIALACAGTMMLAFTACSPTPSTTTTVTSAKPSTSTSQAAAGADASDEASEASQEASTESSAAASADASVDSGAATSAEAATDAGDAAASAAGDIVAGAEDAAQNAASEAANAADNIADQAAGAAGALVDSAQAAQINALLSSGDFTAALSTVEGIGNETLTQAMQALADAAQACNVATEPNSGNIIVYGDDAEVVDGTTNVIPFVNMTHNFTHMQIGFVDRADDPNGYHDASPTSVELKAGNESWKWDTNASNTVTVPGDTSRTWVFETALSDAELPLLTAVGHAQPGQAVVTFTDASAGDRDYSLSQAEIGAFSNLGQFATALQQLRSFVGA